MTKCAPRYPKGMIKEMPCLTYRYWRKEVHISEPLATVLSELWEKYLMTITEEETF